MSKRKLCKHCQKNLAYRPRGLCWGCYENVAVRRLYAPVSKFGERGIADYNGLSALAEQPTRAHPGSPDKLAVLEERAKRGCALHHPHDARADLR